VWSVCLSVCLLVTFVSPAETVAPIEMPFGADSDGPGNHVLDGVQISTGNGQFAWDCPLH